MNNRKAGIATSVPIDDYFAKQMKDPEFAKAYEELEPEFELVSQIIALGLKHKLSQRELAERMGTPRPSIIRMESEGRQGLGFCAAARRGVGLHARGAVRSEEARGQNGSAIG